MSKLKTLAAAAVLAGSFAQASAQECCNKDYKPYPYAYVGVQGGGQVTFTDYQSSKLITPIGAVSVGGFFTPAVGARLHVSGLNEKGGIKGIDQTYDYKFVTSDLDLMLNLTNMFSKKKCHVFNVILLGGVGLSYAWDNDDMTTLVAGGYTGAPLSWSDDRLVHNFRAGLMLDVNVAKHVGVNLEVAANNLHDRFNSKLNGHGDWQLTAMLGVAYKFGFRKKVRTTPTSTVVAAPPVVDNTATEVAVTPAPPVVVEPEPEPEVAPAPRVLESLREEVFFVINRSDVKGAEADKVERVANWLKQHPTADVILTGYADAGTGTAAINKRLSRERAAAVTKLLVEKYGIAASRISSDYKGDTVQPLNPNDRNRVVILTAQEK